MPSPLARASRYGGDATLIVAAAIAAATSYTTIYTDFNIVVVVAGCSVLCVLTVLRLTPQVPSKASFCVALLIGLIPQWWRPPIGNVDRGPLFPLATGLGMLASILLIVGALVVAHRRWLLGALAFLSASAAATLVVQASARPAIDVWIILQQSTRGLLEGRNPYEMFFSGIPAGQTDDCFNYLPFTLVASLPGRVALGDVRYGELLVLLAGSAMLIWVVHRAGRAQAGTRSAGRAERASFALLLLVMAVSLPGTLRITQQAWNESIILGCLLAAIALLLLDRAWLAVVPLALALATKQHVVLILPLWALWPSFGWRRALAAGALAAGICLPWLLANPSRFYGCTVQFFLDLPARPDSISVWKFLPDAARIPAVVALTAGTYLVVHRFLDRSIASLVLGSGLVFAAFDLANKQSFENQWLLACQLLVASLACRAVEQHTRQPLPPDELPSPSGTRPIAGAHDPERLDPPPPDTAGQADVGLVPQSGGHGHGTGQSRLRSSRRARPRAQVCPGPVQVSASWRPIYPRALAGPASTLSPGSANLCNGGLLLADGQRRSRSSRC